MHVPGTGNNVNVIDGVTSCMCPRTGNYVHVSDGEEQKSSRPASQAAWLASQPASQASQARRQPARRLSFVFVAQVFFVFA